MLRFTGVQSAGDLFVGMVLTPCIRLADEEGTGDPGATAFAEALKVNRMLKYMWFYCALVSRAHSLYPFS
jgi:hypothetical protein